MYGQNTIKVVLLVATCVGKTCIISQFVSHQFDLHQVTSLSAQYVSKTIEFPDLGLSIKFDIWDTAGREKYISVSKCFYTDAEVIILVYDITSINSLDEIKLYWYKYVKKFK